MSDSFTIFSNIVLVVLTSPVWLMAIHMVSKNIKSWKEPTTEL